MSTRNASRAGAGYSAKWHSDRFRSCRQCAGRNGGGRVRVQPTRVRLHATAYPRYWRGCTSAAPVATICTKSEHMTDFDLVVRNARAATAADLFECDIGIKDGRIAALARGLPRGTQDIDAAGRWVLPGGID